MPWTSAQHRLFQAAAHNAAIARKHGMSQAEASKMAAEGVKHKAVPQKARGILRGAN